MGMTWLVLLIILISVVCAENGISLIATTALCSCVYVLNHYVRRYIYGD